MTKLKSLLSYTLGRKFNLPIVGKIQFDENNCIEVESDEIAEQLLACDFGTSMRLTYDDGRVVEKTTTHENENDGDKKVVKITKEAIQKLNMSDLKENCALFPQEEWEGFKNKKEFVDYLFIKLND